MIIRTSFVWLNKFSGWGQTNFYHGHHSFKDFWEPINCVPTIKRIAEVPEIAPVAPTTSGSEWRNIFGGMQIANTPTRYQHAVFLLLTPAIQYVSLIDVKPCYRHRPMAMRYISERDEHGTQVQMIIITRWLFHLTLYVLYWGFGLPVLVGDLDSRQGTTGRHTSHF